MPRNIPDTKRAITTHQNMYDQEKVYEFVFRSESLAKSVDKDKTFLIISQEIDSCEDEYLIEYITALNFIRNDKVLDWIENNNHRTTNIGLNWGHLAAVTTRNNKRTHVLSLKCTCRLGNNGLQHLSATIPA